MATLVKYLTIFGIWALVKGHYDFNSKEKRILVDDPSYTQQQFDHLQSEFQDLLVKVNGQQNTIASQQSAIHSLESKLSNESSTVAVLQSKLASQQSGIATQQTIINDLQTRISKDSSTIAILRSQMTSIQSGRGVSFIRWGRKECPGNFTMVYTGYAGGSWFQHKGAAVDYLCMPHEPIWGPNKDKLAGDNYAGYVFGAEYQSPSVYGMVDTKEDVPCTFCHSSYYSTQAMIPGRTACYTGWTEAFHGDLSSGYHDHEAASQYVCVDQHPEALDGGADVNSDKKLFYAVKAKCGSLRCPPYEEEKVLSCVVCVK